MEDAAGNERDKLIVRILADCGLRLAELLGLRLGDLIIQGRDDRFLRVMGKGSRERLVPISPSLFKRIDRYVKGGRPKDAHNDKLFVSLRAKDGDYEPLDSRPVQELTAELAARVGVTDRPANPHALRHAFATWCLRKGMNPVQLQRILGHADLNMISNVYSHLEPGDAGERRSWPSSGPMRCRRIPGRATPGGAATRTAYPLSIEQAIANDGAVWSRVEHVGGKPGNAFQR